MKRQWFTRLGLGYLVGRVELWRMELQSIPWLCFWGFWEDHRNSLSNCHLLRGLESRLWCHSVNQQRTFSSSMQLNTLQYTVLTFFKSFVWLLSLNLFQLGQTLTIFLFIILNNLCSKTWIHGLQNQMFWCLADTWTVSLTMGLSLSDKWAPFHRLHHVFLIFHYESNGQSTFQGGAFVVVQLDALHFNYICYLSHALHCGG
jgi:hypothetical protein